MIQFSLENNGKATQRHREALDAYGVQQQQLQEYSARKKNPSYINFDVPPT